MPYTIRPFVESDADGLAALTLSAIHAIGGLRYSHVQIDAWAARHPGPDRFVARHAKGDLIFVAVDAHDISVAYSLLELGDGASGHLDMLYCHPDHSGKGLADRLLEAAEESARRNAITRLFTEASELARPAFKRAGYEVLHRRNFEIEGVAIHNYAMEKHLT